MNSPSAGSQTVPTGPSYPTGGTPPPPSYPSGPIGLMKPEENCKESYYEQQYVEKFSKSICEQHILEFKQGKYTRRFIENYLDFIHMSGYISNLDYLEFKGKLVQE